MPIWIRFAAHLDQLEKGWTEWQVHPLELIADEDGVRLAIITEYAGGHRDAELLVEPGDFVTMAANMMMADPEKATAAFAFVLSKQYPLDDVEDTNGSG